MDEFPSSSQAGFFANMLLIQAVTCGPFLGSRFVIGGRGGEPLPASSAPWPAVSSGAGAPFQAAAAGPPGFWVDLAIPGLPPQFQ